MGHMWVGLASTCPQAHQATQPPPPSYPGHAPREQFPGIPKKCGIVHSYLLVSAGLGTATHTTSSSGNPRTTTAGGDLAIF